MIPIKLLELENRNITGFNKYPEFIDALNKVLGYEVEKVFKQDELFEGYYLVPVGAIPSNEYNSSLINEKTFLLSVINSSIPQFIDEFKPAGLTNWVIFKDAGTSIISNVNVLNFNKLMTEEMKERNLEYDYYSPISKDGTYETVVKSILKYLELYDDYLKSKK